ncbi:Cytochrome c oxidase subunit 2 precursor [Betaproteobacteria bacterium MOLA814]|jgi:cytochrome c oxidase subunit 2|nr:Cytochrome c oxidase subunit 2 precursor [Betaproteobacteria bacterium MOLA814]
MTQGNVPNRPLALAARMTAAVAAFVATAVHAVNDLPGGPAVNQLNLHPAVTQIAAEQRWLHWFMLIICTVIFLAVFGVMFYSILKHRRSVGHKAQVISEPIWVELGWTIIPFLIVIGMALPATKVLVAMKDTTNADLTVKATGMQWKWGYDYINGEGEGISFLSAIDASHRAMSNSGNVENAPDDYLLKVDNPLVVPIGQKVRIITTANDVIHSWMVPAFGVKQDAIPGFVRDTWFRAEKEGMFYGQCTELCGKEHAYMPINVKVVSAVEYTAWVEGQQKAMLALAEDPSKVWELGALVSRGKQVYGTNCVACHQATGKGAGAIKALDGSAVVLNSDHTEVISTLLNGRGNGAMPAWKQLSDTEIAAVITYAKNSWSNQSGDLIQPAEVQAARNQ